MNLVAVLGFSTAITFIVCTKFNADEIKIIGGMVVSWGGFELFKRLVRGTWGASETEKEE